MPPHKTIFSFDLRVLMCDQCGAAIDDAIDGCAVRCRYCQAVNQVVARDDGRDALASRAAPQMSEARRLEVLRSQLGRPPHVPAGLEPLARDGMATVERFAQALRLWQQARRAILKGSAFSAHERLHFLTVVLHTRFKANGDHKRMRALLESALDVLDDPRHRQVLRGMMARDAARLGDVEAAQRWLAGVSASSDDIHVDTAYRLSHAYLASVRGAWRGVIDHLGDVLGEIPIALDAQALTAMLRANAHERLGDELTAHHHLWHIALRWRGGLATAAAIVRANPEVVLCARSLPAVTRAIHRPIESEAPHMRTVGSWFGAAFAFAAAVAGVVLAFCDTPLLASAEWALAAALFIVALGTALTIMALQSARERAWKATTVAGTATLLSPVGTPVGNAHGDGAFYDLLVVAPAALPWRTHWRCPTWKGGGDMPQVGTRWSAQIDANNPHAMDVAL